MLIETLNQKMSRRKNFIYEPRISIQNLKIKAKKNRLEKGQFFGVTLIQAVVSKTLRLFYKITFCSQNIWTLKNQPLHTTTSRDKWGGGHNGPSPSYSFVK